MVLGFFKVRDRRVFLGFDVFLGFFSVIVLFGLWLLLFFYKFCK